MKRLTLAGVLMAGLLMMAGGCSYFQGATAPESSLPQWIGKDRVELAKQMGQPKDAVAMGDTGGEMLFYGYEGHHYVFETGPDGKIISAVQTR